MFGCSNSVIYLFIYTCSLQNILFIEIPKSLYSSQLFVGKGPLAGHMQGADDHSMCIKGLGVHGKYGL